MVKQKILVTGSGGQLGREIQNLADSFPFFDFIFLSKEDLPVQQGEAISAMFNRHRPQFCINCAAYTAVDKAESEKELAFLVNGKAPGLLAAACKDFDCRFIHISTDYVFDGSATAPYKEDSAVNPQGVYGASKLEGERQAVQSNIDTIIIRTSWVYSEYGKNFVKTMLKLMSEKEQIGVVNDQIGSPTYAADLAEAIMQIIKAPATDHSPLTTHDSRLTTHANLYHFSNKGVISWYDFALAIKEISSSQCRVNPIATSQYPTPAKRPAWSVLDTTRIQETYGISLKDWKGSLKTCIGRISS